MLALRWSFAKDLVLVALLGVTTSVAAPSRHRAGLPARAIHSVHVALVAPRPHSRVDHRALADERYRQRNFVGASLEMQLAVGDDPSLQAEAELYEQFAHAWSRAAAPSRGTRRFEALRYARRLDLALGGVWGAELDAELRHVAPMAVPLYRRAANHEGEQLALATCDALGVKPLDF